MMNYIWALMLIVSIIVAAFTGRLDTTMQEGMRAANDSIMTVLGFAGIMCLWTGLMKIAEEGGMVQVLCKLAKPVAKRLFPDVPPESPAMGAIMLNVTANLLGMGNAATPLGLRAMHELDKLNAHSTHASNAMCMFVVLNTASIQLIPSTIIAIRSAAGSKAPFEIMVPIWITSLCCVLAGICMAFLLQGRREKPVCKPGFCIRHRLSKQKRMTCKHIR